MYWFYTHLFSIFWFMLIWHTNLSKDLDFWTRSIIHFEIINLYFKLFVMKINNLLKLLIRILAFIISDAGVFLFLWKKALNNIGMPNILQISELCGSLSIPFSASAIPSQYLLLLFSLCLYQIPWTEYLESIIFPVCSRSCLMSLRKFTFEGWT